MTGSVTVSHPLHDPTDRVLAAELGAWQLRQFADTDQRLVYFAKRGFAHVQLWHPTERVSIVTPSRLTGGNFELWSEDGRLAAASWEAIELALCGLGVRAPTRNEVRAIERWFVLPFEGRAGRLLRTWWAADVARPSEGP